MDWRQIISISATSALGMSLLAGSAAGQQKSPKEQLVGTWTLVSHESVSMYGANPKGVAFFDADGHFIITVMRSDSNTQVTIPRGVQSKKIKQRHKGP